MNFNIPALPKREAIFKGLDYDPETRLIYTSCGMGPIGQNIRGKIKWDKKYKRKRNDDRN